MTNAIIPNAVNTAAAGKTLKMLESVIWVPINAPTMNPIFTGIYAKDITRPRTFSSAEADKTLKEMANTADTTPFRTDQAIAKGIKSLITPGIGHKINAQAEPMNRTFQPPNLSDSAPRIGARINVVNPLAPITDPTTIAGASPL